MCSLPRSLNVHSQALPRKHLPLALAAPDHQTSACLRRRSGALSELSSNYCLSHLLMPLGLELRCSYAVEQEQFLANICLIFQAELLTCLD